MSGSVLIVGGDSTIGNALAVRLAKDGWHVKATSRKPGAGLPLDLAQPPQSWPDLPKADVAFLCAAVTSLDACENDPQATARINVTHMQALAQRLLAQGSYTVFLSTNQVFDGSAAYPAGDERTCPMNEYGRQKAAFEHWLMAQGKPAAVMRLTKVISGPLPILAKWQETLNKGETIEAFGDLVFAPLPLAAVMDGLTLLAQNCPLGIFQLSGKADISYYDIACALAEKERVKKTSALDAGIKPQFLPRHGTLKISGCFAGIPIAEPLAIVQNR